MTALSIPQTPSAETVGLHRRLARITDRAGLIRTIAIDHPDNYLLLFDDDLSKVSFEEVVESKLEMIAELSQHATSVLADPVYCFGQSIVTGALPGDVGVISGIEDLYYTPATSPVGFDTELRLKDGWTPAKLAALGADAAKLVVFHREDGDAADVAHQHEVVAQAAADCHAVGLPLIVEPLWFPVAGESMDDPEVRERRRRSVVSSARSFHDVGTDIMKVEFPVLDLTDLDAAHQACADLDEAIDGPWVLLSAGVTFEGFRTQIDVAADHGCSGFMAGRAIWGDAVGRLGAEERAAGAALAARRLDELAEVLDGRGALAWTPVPMADAASVVGPTWYRSFGTTGS
jgi:tagatose-1,6-bisphosphate aldolase